MTVPDVKLDSVTAELTTRELSVVAFVTVRPLRVVSPCKEALAVTVRELSVVVPAGTLNPPLDTVTFPPLEGLRIMLEVAEIKRLLLGLMAMEANWTGADVDWTWLLGIPMINMPLVPAEPAYPRAPAPPPDPLLATPTPPGL